MLTASGDQTISLWDTGGCHCGPAFRVLAKPALHLHALRRLGTGLGREQGCPYVNRPSHNSSAPGWLSSQAMPTCWPPSRATLDL